MTHSGQCTSDPQCYHHHHQFRIAGNGCSTGILHRSAGEQLLNKIRTFTIIVIGEINAKLTNKQSYGIHSTPLFPYYQIGNANYD